MIEPVIKPSKYLALVKNKPFMSLWSAQAVSLTAQNLIHITLITRLFELYKSSLATSLLLVVLTVPAIFLASYAGFFADTNNRRRILITTNFLRALSVLLFLLITSKAGALGLIFFFINAFLFSVVNQFFIPAETATIPALVKNENLLKANALFTQTLYITFVVGVSLAGPIQGLFGTIAPFPLAALLFVISGLLVIGIPKTISANVETHQTHFFKDLVKQTISTFKLVKDDKKLLQPILQITVSQVAIGVMVVLAPGFVNDVLKLNVKESGLLITPAGIGMVATALLIGYSGAKKRAGMVKTGFLLIGLLLIGLAFIRELPVLFSAAPLVPNLPVDFSIKTLLIIMSGLMGAGLALIYVPAQTSLQEHSESHNRGRVFGFLNMTINTSATLPLLIAGIIADVLDIKTVIYSFGILILVFLIAESIAFRKS